MLLYTPPSRRGFSRIDALVVVLILLVVAGLILIGPIPRQRIGDDQSTQCIYNLWQIGTAIRNYPDVYKKLPPAWNPDPLFSIPPQGQALGKSIHGPIHFILLPFVEQDPLFRNSKNEAGQFHYQTGTTASTILPLFFCPSDPSLNTCVNSHDYASCNYAASLWVFDPREPGTLNQAMPDGTAYTIMFVERYRSCGTSQPAWANHPSAPGGIPNTPVFGWSEFAHWVGPVKGNRISGNPSYSNGTLGFQVRPATQDCDPSITQSPHSRGMHVLFGDGSVKTVTGAVSLEDWRHACIPNDGLPANMDWIE
jgi:prepilin-type processing-associated H-X9-DG protein